MISAKCITYGRVDMLEESLASFLRQSYDDPREMVIVNDYPLQKLVFNHPRVRIFNMDETFKTIGEKENFAVEQCAGDIIAVWDDDDIALRNHLHNIDDYFVEGSDLLHWNNGILLVGHEIAGLGSLGNSGIIYSKDVWQRLGGHALENAGYDMTFVVKIQDNNSKVVRAVPPDDEVSWAYNWGNGSYHMSGLGKDTGEHADVITRHSEHIENLRKKGEIPTGEIHLNPHWKRDYEVMLKDYLKKIKK